MISYIILAYTWDCPLPIEHYGQGSREQAINTLVEFSSSPEVEKVKFYII